MYVWVDALTNYITGISFATMKAISKLALLAADVHIIGKDVGKLHAQYWRDADL